MYDIDKIREDFPILQREINKRALIYLDNAATTQKPNCVIDSISKAYRETNANVHRGVHTLSQEATELHEGARRRVAAFIGAGSSDEIIFTRGTTESINLVATSFGDTFVNEGDEIIISTMEHHANIVPWQMLAERKGASLKVIRLNSIGELDLEHYQSLLSERTKIVALSHASNVLGTINPIKELIDLAHSRGVSVLIDGAQAVAHSKVDVQDLDADFYVFSGHKLYAPTGIGVLYAKRELLEKMPPYMGGGEMIAKVTFEKTTYNELPFKFEAGTPDYIGSQALAKAIDYIEGVGLEAIAKYEAELLDYASKRLLDESPNAYIFGQAKDKTAILSFGIGDIHPFDLGTLLDQLGIAIRTGHHCAEPLLNAYGYTAMARASFALYNTKEEIDKFFEALHRVVAMF